MQAWFFLLFFILSLVSSFSFSFGTWFRLKTSPGIFKKKRYFFCNVNIVVALKTMIIKSLVLWITYLPTYYVKLWFLALAQQKNNVIKFHLASISKVLVYEEFWMQMTRRTFQLIVVRGESGLHTAYHALYLLYITTI